MNYLYKKTKFVLEISGHDHDDLTIRSISQFLQQILTSQKKFFFTYYKNNFYEIILDLFLFLKYYNYKKYKLDNKILLREDYLYFTIIQESFVINIEMFIFDKLLTNDKIKNSLLIKKYLLE